MREGGRRGVEGGEREREKESGRELTAAVRWPWLLACILLKSGTPFRDCLFSFQKLTSFGMNCDFLWRFTRLIILSSLKRKEGKEEEEEEEEGRTIKM